MNVREKYENYAMEHGQIVTVFILSNNRKDYLNIMINSVLMQSYSNFCLIVLDNFSEDGTKEMIEVNSDPRIFIIQRQSTVENPNFIYAFDICKTKYMVVFHDDDIVEQDYLKVMLHEIMQRKVQLLSSSVNLIDANGDYLKESSAISGGYEGTSYFKAFISKDRNAPILWFPCNMYETEFYQKKEMSTFFDEKKVGTATDQYLVLQTERYGGRVYTISARLYKYRVHRTQESFLHGGEVELQLFKYLSKDDYYRNLIILHKRISYKYIKSAYKALAINYARNKNREIRKSMKIKKYIERKFGFKMLLLAFIFEVSRILFDFTIVPYAYYLRKQIYG